MSDETIILCRLWEFYSNFLASVISSRESLNLDTAQSENKKCMPHCSMKLAHSRYTNFCSQRHISEMVTLISGSFLMLALNDGVSFADTLTVFLLGR